ncbi:hypothetical protein Ddc_18365 [Ditylenchus destructor]|nr:hypothetical protein Ddc_18365 [Ditylenchus destructor]
MPFLFCFEQKYRPMHPDVSDLADLISAKMPEIRRAVIGKRGKKLFRDKQKHMAFEIIDVTYLNEDQIPQEAKKNYGEVQNKNFPFIVRRRTDGEKEYIPIEKFYLRSGQLIFDRD